MPTSLYLADVTEAEAFFESSGPVALSDVRESEAFARVAVALTEKNKMKLKFEKKEDDVIFPIITIDEVVGPLSTGFPENLGFIFEDELGCHWKIADDYSNVIELE